MNGSDHEKICQRFSLKTTGELNQTFIFVKTKNKAHNKTNIALNVFLCNFSKHI